MKTQDLIAQTILYNLSQIEKCTKQIDSLIESIAGNNEKKIELREKIIVPLIQSYSHLQTVTEWHFCKKD